MSHTFTNHRNCFEYENGGGYLKRKTDNDGSSLTDEQVTNAVNSYLTNHPVQAYDDTEIKKEISEISEYVKPTKAKATICFLFDDTAVDARADILDEYGFKATFSIRGVDTAIDSASIKNLAKRGHDFSVYAGIGARPNFTGDVVEEWKTFIQGSLDFLSSCGVYLPTLYSCSEHKGSVKLQEVITQLGFKYMSCSYMLHNGETWETDDQIEWMEQTSNTPFKVALKPETIASNRTFDIIKEKIDAGIASNAVITLFAHKIVSGDLTEEVFRQVMEYVKGLQNAGTVDVLTMRQLYNKYHPEEGRELDYTRFMSAVTNK